MTGLNIVFAGTPEFGLPCLEALFQSSHHLKAVYTQPDRPAGRGRKLQASAVKAWALAHKIPVYQPLNFKTPESVAELSALNPDVLVVIAYGLILPPAILAIPKFGCINVHASLLPRWRGASPIQQAVLSGDIQSGVTIMQMDAGMDTGAMLSKVACFISDSDTAGSLHDHLAQIAAAPLLDILNSLANHPVKGEVQDNNLASYAGKITKENARINWQDTAITLDRLIRAFNPWPIAYTSLGEEIVRIHKARVVELPCLAAPGTIIKIDKQGILVATGSKALLIEIIQFSGARAVSVADWLNSGKKQLYVGLIL